MRMKVTGLAMCEALQKAGDMTKAISKTRARISKRTLTQPAGEPQRAELVAVVIVATVAGTVTLEVPTGTALVPRPCIGGANAWCMQAFNASDSTGGSAISVAYPLATGVPLALDWLFSRVIGIGSNRNVTARVAFGSAGNAQTRLTTGRSTPDQSGFGVSNWRNSLCAAFSPFSMSLISPAASSFSGYDPLVFIIVSRTLLPTL